MRLGSLHTFTPRLTRDHSVVVVEDLATANILGNHHLAAAIADHLRVDRDLSTGFVGTPLITDALTTAGAVDAAYRLLLQSGCPSWLYSGSDGRPTVWESYDSMLPDGTINPAR